jgi:chorismate synthase
MPAGLALAPAALDPDLARRQGLGANGHPYPGASARMGIEHDAVEILGGVLAGLTTGAPIALLVWNRDHHAWKGRAIEPLGVPRPGHADLAAAVKYGYRDLRLGLERASARETVARVAVGAICRNLLAEFGIRVGSYVSAIGGVSAVLSAMSLEERLEAAAASDLKCPSATAAAKMAARLREIARAGDTAGGVLEVIALGVPPGLGSHVHWDRRLSGRLGGALLSIPGVKGVEIGEAFETAGRPGSEAHDEIALAASGSGLTRPTNRAGGLEGGIQRQPIILRAAMKPSRRPGQRCVRSISRPVRRSLPATNGLTPARSRGQPSSAKRWCRSCWPMRSSRSSAAIR